MFHSRSSQRRNFVLNMLSIVGAYWIISTLLSLNSINHRTSPEKDVILNANEAPEEIAEKEGPRIRARRNEKNIEPKVDEKAKAEHVEEKNAVKADAKENSLENGANDNEKPNIPQPNRIFYNGNSPIYRRGDPNQAGERGAAVKIDKDRFLQCGEHSIMQQMDEVDVYRILLFQKLPPEERKKYDEGFKRNSFNEYASEMISLHRSLPNNTDEMCKNVKYSEHLPDASVIICFHNEAWSALLRTVHSVLDRTPEKLLTEVILVDDFSDLDHLKKPLEDYLSQFGKVRIVRMESRVGLIRARLKGASVARGTTLIYLDSHCECMEGWVEPLLDRIAQNTSNVVTPVIDTIDLETFEYHLSGHNRLSVGGFNWGLVFNWHLLPDRDYKAMKTRIDPVPSPTMAGGLFAIDRSYFEKLGTYDPGFDIWGGENLEISFKIWMCGGRLEIVPCSHVGHIFRKKSPYKWRTGVNVLQRNNVRLAEVWLDEYKDIYYERINHKLIRNRGNQKFCVDHEVGRNAVNDAVIPYPCHLMGGNQFWLLSKEGEIRRDEYCIDYTGRGSPVTYECHGSKGNQLWEYNHESGRLYHPVSRKCLALSDDDKTLVMASCDMKNARQSWKFQYYNATVQSKSLNG
ncbi:unnamed protein product [Toxocara canis]|uniref:Polypeptide N-acetylgalactosaminyltransferase n=1 Tax=Toxocara canis TaxID=6265 RepID=A0A183UQU3_TOXCA|nr:unnamed protein product [Toxocara canis]